MLCVILSYLILSLLPCRGKKKRHLPEYFYRAIAAQSSGWMNTPNKLV